VVSCDCGLTRLDSGLGSGVGKLSKGGRKKMIMGSSLGLRWDGDGDGMGCMHAWWNGWMDGWMDGLDANIFASVFRGRLDWICF